MHESAKPISAVLAAGAEQLWLPLPDDLHSVSLLLQAVGCTLQEDPAEER